MSWDRFVPLRARGEPRAAAPSPSSLRSPPGPGRAPKAAEAVPTAGPAPAAPRGPGTAAEHRHTATRPSARSPGSLPSVRPQPAGPGPARPAFTCRWLLSAAAPPARPLPRLPPGQTAAAANRKRRQRCAVTSAPPLPEVSRTAPPGVRVSGERPLPAASGAAPGWAGPRMGRGLVRGGRGLVLGGRGLVRGGRGLVRERVSGRCRVSVCLSPARF